MQGATVHPGAVPVAIVGPGGAQADILEPVRVSILTRIRNEGCVGVYSFEPNITEGRYPEKFIRGLRSATEHVVKPYLPSSEKGHLAIWMFIILIWILLIVLDNADVVALRGWQVFLVLFVFTMSTTAVFEFSLRSKFKRFYMELQSWAALQNQNLDGYHWDVKWREDPFTGSFCGAGLGRGLVRTGCGRSEVQLHFTEPRPAPGPGLVVRPRQMVGHQPTSGLQAYSDAPMPPLHPASGGHMHQPYPQQPQTMPPQQINGPPAQWPIPPPQQQQQHPVQNQYPGPAQPPSYNEAVAAPGKR